MLDEPVALVTGATRGIGREVAMRLAAHGLTTLVGAREPSHGEAVAEALRREGRSAASVALDVSDGRSVAGAADLIASEFGRLDVLVNNAGVLLDGRVPPSALPIEVLTSTYEINVFGVVRVINAMLPLLRAASWASIVNVSSAMGSLTLAQDPGWEYSDVVQAAYNSSKTALNSLTVQYAKELRGEPIAINAVHPGHCSTDLNRHSGPRSAKQGAEVIARFATMSAGGPSGGFFDDSGALPW